MPTSVARSSPLVHAVLDRAESRRGGYPSGFVESLNDARTDHVVRVGARSSTCRTDAGYRRWAAAGRPLRLGGVASVSPARTGETRRSLQVAQVGCERSLGSGAEDLRAVFDADVHVDAVQKTSGGPSRRCARRARRSGVKSVTRWRPRRAKGCVRRNQCAVEARESGSRSVRSERTRRRSSAA